MGNKRYVTVTPMLIDGKHYAAGKTLTADDTNRQVRMWIRAGNIRPVEKKKR